MKLLLVALLLNETSMVAFAFLLIKLAGIAVLVIGVAVYIGRTPTAPPAKRSTPVPVPQTQGERTLWIIVWLIVAAVGYFLYSLVSGMVG